jgi:hypothetical protein
MPSKVIEQPAAQQYTSQVSQGIGGKEDTRLAHGRMGLFGQAGKCWSKQGSCNAQGNKRQVITDC